MKKILLTVVLGIAVGAAAQSTSQPAPGQPSTPSTQGQTPAQGQPATTPAPGQTATPAPGQSNPGQSSAAPAQTAPAAAPVIKDPAEYNAYVAAVQATDPNAKISGLEAFLNQYPNSVMKNQALEILMQTYQQSNNMKKTMETGTKLVAADPCNVRALTLLAYLDRVAAQGGDPNSKQLLADGRKYGEQGLQCLPKASGPGHFEDERSDDRDFQRGDRNLLSAG